jgi:leucyl-tRNA synthetase
MGKRYHNVINPDDVIAEHGADCLRLYEMFLGPLDQSSTWSTQSISGASKFLQKFWKLYVDES